MLFNAVSARTLTIPAAEILGQSDGKTFQVFALKNAPVFKQLNTDTPYAHVVVQVSGLPWTQVEDLPAGAGTFYRLDAVAGEISFGNFDPTNGTGHGTIPAAGSTITAMTYRYAAGGVSGNIGAARISGLRTPMAGITAVTNLASSFGASDEEPIEDTLRRAPEVRLATARSPSRTTSSWPAKPRPTSSS